MQAGLKFAVLLFQFPEGLDYWQEYHAQLNLALFHELGAADPSPKLFSTLILVNEHPKKEGRASKYRETDKISSCVGQEETKIGH